MARMNAGPSDSRLSTKNVEAVFLKQVKTNTGVPSASLRTGFSTVSGAKLRLTSLRMTARTDKYKCNCKDRSRFSSHPYAQIRALGTPASGMTNKKNRHPRRTRG